MMLQTHRPSQRAIKLSVEVKRIMDEDQVYDPNELYDLIYNHSGQRHDYRDVRDAIQLAKGF